MISASKGAFFLLALSTAIAHAAPPPAAAAAQAAQAKAAAAQLDEAKRLAKQGATQYALARFADAADSYAKSYEVVPTPGVLFNLGQCHLELKNYERAIFFFEGYLRDKPDAPNAALVGDLIAEARRNDAEAKAEAKAQHEAEAAERRAALFVPPPPAPPRPVPVPYDKKRLAAVALGGGSIALISVGVYLGLRSQMLGDQARAQPGTAVAHHFAESRHAYVIGASVVGGIGAAALVASSVLAYFGWRHAPHLGVTASSHAGAFSVAGTW